jgi:hypothetical protein
MEGQKMPKKKDQAINNDLQNTTQETKDLATRTSLISGVNTGGFSLISGVNTGGFSLISGVNTGGFSLICGVNTGGVSLISGVNTGGVSLYSYIIHGITFKIYCLHFI